jgi:hypothetical protein
MIEPRGAPFRYRLVYRRDDAPTRLTFSLAVLAANADEARRQAKLIDPHFMYTVPGGVRREETR